MNKLQLIKALSKNHDANWYRMEEKDSAADVYIYDEISWFGVSADQFVKDLQAIKADTIRLHLNTPGGSIFDGIAIYNALKQHKAKVETYIEGLAASSGSIVALAGDKVYMAENAFYMIHEPWVLTVGDSAELRKTADLLDKISGVMVNTYMKVSGKDEKQIKQWLQAETWFTAEEAKEAGFVDEITDEIEAQARHDLSIYDNVPEKLLSDFEKHSQPDNPDTEKETVNETRQIRESMRMRLELETV
jgi:ATP-dependent Clp protease, protease subunit